MPWETEDNRALVSVATHLEHLANAARINLLYSETERRELVAQYRQLAQACVEARSRIHNAGPNDGLSSWEERVQKLGEDEARRVTQPLTDAVAATRKANMAFDAFRKDHPLIAKLLAGTTDA